MPWINNAVVETAAEKMSKSEAKVELEARVAALEAARESVGVGKYTIEQIDHYLNAKYDQTTFDALGLAIHKLPDTAMSKAARDAVVAMLIEIKKKFWECKEIDRAIAIEVIK